MSDHTKTETAGLVWLKWSKPIINSFPQETHELLSEIIEGACEAERLECRKICDDVEKIATAFAGNMVAGCAREIARRIRERGDK